MLQHRNGPEAEVVREDRSRNSAPSPAAGSKSIPRAPQCVSKVVDVPAQPEQSAIIHLALVLAILLKHVPLDLRAKFQRHSQNVQRRTDDQRRLREVLAIDGRGCLRADEEERVERVPERVQSADREAVLRRHLLAHHRRAVDVLLQHACYRHSEDDRAVRAQAQQTVERCVGEQSGPLRQHLAAELLDEVAANTVGEDAILEEWVEGARADEAGRADVVGLFDAALDVVSGARHLVVGFALGGGHGGALGDEVERKETSPCVYTSDATGWCQCFVLVLVTNGAPLPSVGSLSPRRA
jgi:hypothetical protein